MKRVAAQVADEEARASSLDASIVHSREQAAAALREMYKQSSMAGYAGVLAVSDPREILRGIQSLDVVARRQRDAVDTFEHQAEESRALRSRLERSREELAAAIRETDAEEKRLAAARAERLHLLDRVKKEKSLNQTAADELRRAARELEKALAALPPGAPPPTVSVDFSRLRGTLPWPVDGAVSIPFGEIRHPRFGTVTPHPGWDIEVAPGATVRAVAAGRVLFSRRFGGYGRTVVLDHGGRYLSVYARLAAATVHEGADLLPGQEIGFAEEGGENGKSSIYFEIRFEGQAVDPAGWMRPDLRER